MNLRINTADDYRNRLLSCCNADFALVGKQNGGIMNGGLSLLLWN